MRNITSILHPDYREKITDWSRWRSTYDAGRQFINKYLKQYSKREQVDEFNARKEMSYCPAFSAAAVNDVKNSIYQRMTDIHRIGGDKSYQSAIKGLEGGVDLVGSSMNKFMGQTILAELLVLAKVGIYVDMPKLSGETLAETYKARPYLYHYCAEDIRSWTTVSDSGECVYTNVLLKDYVREVDPDTGLIVKQTAQYRRMWLDPKGEGVWIQLHSPDPKIPPREKILLKGMKRIPFIVLELNESLMTNICDYQIALMNLASTDLAYLFRSNFPFYVEQYEPRADNVWAQNRLTAGDTVPPGDEPDDQKAQEIKLGVASGRRYPKGMDAPQFISPSSEPMIVSMQKQEQMKNEIRHLLNLTLSNIEPKFASAESKNMDQRSLESGLSNIGLTLEYGEREIGKVWSYYLGSDVKAPTINYPQSYSLKSDESRRQDAKQLAELMPAAPSIAFKKEVGKKIATVLLEHSVDPKIIEKINAEIDAAPYIGGASADVKADIESGIVSEETACLARGYSNPKEEISKARTEHADRLARIQEAQTSPEVAGVTDTNPKKGDQKDTNPGAGRPPTNKDPE